MEEIKTTSRKITVPVEQQVNVSVEEIWAVRVRVVESVEWTIENSIKDVKDSLIEVVVTM